MGPNDAARQYIDPDIINDQRLNPPADVLAKLVELAYLAPPTSTSTPSAGTSCGRDGRPAARSRGLR